MKLPCWTRQGKNWQYFIDGRTEYAGAVTATKHEGKPKFYMAFAKRKRTLKNLGRFVLLRDAKKAVLRELGEEDPPSITITPLERKWEFSGKVWRLLDEDQKALASVGLISKGVKTFSYRASVRSSAWVKIGTFDTLEEARCAIQERLGFDVPSDLEEVRENHLTTKRELQTQFKEPVGDPRSRWRIIG